MNEPNVGLVGEIGAARLTGSTPVGSSVCAKLGRGDSALGSYCCCCCSGATLSSWPLSDGGDGVRGGWGMGNVEAIVRD